ncbi:MAG: helix-turn-helix transcriptional regulator [Pseudomonadota bacterium]|nr:helix-turn-helix transcriptional regulator [Pseudomonadota bacterium]
MAEMVTIPRAEYDRLVAAAEGLSDIEAYDRAKAALATGEEELIPSDYVERILNGESPLKVWRAYRGLTQVKLSEASGVNRVQIADIEAGRKTGSVATLKALAEALGVTIDEIV